MYDNEHLDREDLTSMHAEVDPDELYELAWLADLECEGSEDPTDAGRMFDAISRAWSF